METMTTPWEILETFDNEALAELAAEKLRQTDIPVVVQPEGAASAFMGASSPTAVLVPPDRLAAAKDALHD